MNYLPADLDEKNETRIFASNGKMRRIDPENRWKVRIWLLITIVVLAISNALLTLFWHLSFNLAEIVIDFSIFVFVAAIIFINYTPSRVVRSLALKKMIYSVTLFYIIFFPIFTLQFILYSAGYTQVFNFEYFAVEIVLINILNFFITTSWGWNRKFVDIDTLGGVKIRTGENGVTELERGVQLSAREEDLLRRYIVGKISRDRILSELDEAPYRDEVINSADVLLKRLKENYRW